MNSLHLVCGSSLCLTFMTPLSFGFSFLFPGFGSLASPMTGMRRNLATVGRVVLVGPQWTSCQTWLSTQCFSFELRFAGVMPKMDQGFLDTPIFFTDGGGLGYKATQARAAWEI